MVASLTENVAALTSLIEQGLTIEAMHRFYVSEVFMQENETQPRVGKAVCLDHERRMLAGVKSQKATLLHQAINEPAGVVFNEWHFAFTDLKGASYQLTEVAVQYWRNHLIYREKFYYNHVIRLESDKSEESV